MQPTFHFHILIQQHVRPAPGHIGSDGDCAGRTGAGHHLGLFRILFGVQYAVRNTHLLQALRQHF